MIGWHMYLELWNCCMFCMCGFLFLRWSSIYWCEQMREAPVVNRVMEVPLRSLSGLDSTDLSFLIGLWPMYCLSFSTLLTIVKFLYFCLVLASWCALDSS